MEDQGSPTEARFDRKRLLQAGVAAAAVPAVVGMRAESARADTGPIVGGDVEEMTIAQMQAEFAAGTLTSLRLTRRYLNRIEHLDRRGPTLNSVLELNPDAEEIAAGLDRERRNGKVRGPLHGIPVLLKGNIDTADKMATTAGSMALLGAPPSRDATVASRLRDAGAVILGKANLSEWANFRGFQSSSGWSGVGGQTRMPYYLDRNPCGSSSGSGAAVSANLCAATLGTETDGSIVCPSSINGVVGIKPTVGLTSRAGVIPISHSQDTVGPHGRTVADAAAVLGALVGVDTRDSATAASAGKFHRDYVPFVVPNGLVGARIGVMRAGVTGYSPETDAVYEEALETLAAGGATLVDPADLATIDEISAGDAEITVLLYEFKRDLNAYLATRTGVPVRTLAETIAFNEANAARELKWFGQELFELAEADLFDDATYAAALARARQIGGELGIDATLAEHDLDALVAPTGSPSWPIDLVNGDHFLGASSSPAAIAGYPIVNVPMGDAFGLPVGLSIMGTAWSEPTLIKLAAGFEATAKARQKPGFLPTLPLDGPLRGRPEPITRSGTVARAQPDEQTLRAAKTRPFGLI